MVTSLIWSSNVLGSFDNRQILNAFILISVRFPSMFWLTGQSLINVVLKYCFADGVIVWRMRVLCSFWLSAKYTLIPVISLIVTARKFSSIFGQIRFDTQYIYDSRYHDDYFYPNRAKFNAFV